VDYTLQDLEEAQRAVDVALAAWAAPGGKEASGRHDLENAQGLLRRIRKELLGSGRLAPTEEDLVQTALNDMHPSATVGSTVRFDDKTYVLHRYPSRRVGQTVLEWEQEWVEQPPPSAPPMN
jgi:hypothetical protein